MSFSFFGTWMALVSWASKTNAVELVWCLLRHAGKVLRLMVATNRDWHLPCSFWVEQDSLRNLNMVAATVRRFAVWLGGGGGGHRERAT